MAHFPQLLRNFPAFEGPFDAFKLEAKNCDVDGKETRYRPGDWYHVAEKQTHAARFEVETSEIEFWFHATPVR